MVWLIESKINIHCNEEEGMSITTIYVFDSLWSTEELADKRMNLNKDEQEKDLYQKTEIVIDP